MHKKYIYSMRKDKQCLDSASTNMIRDILIMWGIYDEYARSYQTILIDDFRSYYINILNRESFWPKHNFIGEYHYLNKGIKILRNISNQNTIVTYARRLKTLCQTSANSTIRIPINTHTIIEVLFEHMYNNRIVKTIFIEEILKKCRNYTNESINYPYDCNMSILGFIHMFINNINILPYSLKHKRISKQINDTMIRILDIYKIKNQCVLRNNMR